MEIALTPLEFARRARRLYGDKEAVVDGDKRFTYSEFLERCDRWSSALQGLGVGRMLVEECVGMAQSRNILEVMVVTSSDDFFVSCGFDFTLPGEKKALFIQTRKTDD